MRVDTKILSDYPAFPSDHTELFRALAILFLPLKSGTKSGSEASGISSNSGEELYNEIIDGLTESLWLDTYKDASIPKLPLNSKVKGICRKDGNAVFADEGLFYDYIELLTELDSKATVSIKRAASVVKDYMDVVSNYTPTSIYKSRPTATKYEGRFARANFVPLPYFFKKVFGIAYNSWLVSSVAEGAYIFGRSLAPLPDRQVQKLNPFGTDYFLSAGETYKFYTEEELETFDPSAREAGNLVRFGRMVDITNLGSHAKLLASLPENPRMWPAGPGRPRAFTQKNLKEANYKGPTFKVAYMAKYCMLAQCWIFHPCQRLFVEDPYNYSGENNTAWIYDFQNLDYIPKALHSEDPYEDAKTLEVLGRPEEDKVSAPVESVASARIEEEREEPW